MQLKYPLLFFFSFFFSIIGNTYGQDYIRGRVLSATDSTALYGASIYLDGTSYGVSAGEQGEFNLPLNNSSFASLIISSMGYETLALNPGAIEEGKRIIVYLRESRESLDEVFVAEDTWSRAKKLGIFRREFLGKTKAALKCRILNEDAIRLRYNPVTERLTAYATEPLKVLNRHLGYMVTYNLQDFRVDFSTGSSGLQLVHMVYYEGFSFFDELNRKTSKRHRRNRDNAFKGSALHFLRSLATQKLQENGYQIFRKNFEVAPYAYFAIEKEENSVTVNLLEENLNILFNKNYQSNIQQKGFFSIDLLGNHSPPQNVIFGGVMGTKRIAEMVPLNYNYKN